MKKIRRLLDTKKLEELQKQKDEDRLMNIGLKKNTVEGDKLDCPIEYSIERMQASIDSGFVRIPNNLSEDEILEFLLK